MASANLFPAGNPAYNDGWAVNSGTWHDALATNDGNTTYAYKLSDAANWVMRFDYDNLPADAVAVSSVTQHHIVAKSATGCTVQSQQLYHSGSAYTYGTGVTVTVSYVDNSEALAAPAGGWDVTKVNAYTYGCRQGNATCSVTVKVTQLYNAVVYTPSGMFAITYALPLIGVIGSMAAMRGMMRKLMPKVRYTERELESIREDIRRSQRGYAFMAA